MEEGKICLHLHPIQGSTPIRTTFPFPIFHTKKLPTISKAQRTDFQHIEIHFFFLMGDLIHSRIFKGCIYFCTAMLTQRPDPCIIFQTFFAARDFAKIAGISVPNHPKILYFPNSSRMSKVNQKTSDF